MSKMIPLHIADQAVAACEAEIQKLREENARLKQQVERLEKVEFAVGVIRDILGDHFGRHYYYKVDYAMRGETLKTHE